MLIYDVPKNQGHPIEPNEPNIDNWLMDTRWCMDQKLNKMEGPMAAYLRRERFRTWHTDGDSWTSLYGEQILKDLATNNAIPARHDLCLFKTEDWHYHNWLTFAVMPTFCPL